MQQDSSILFTSHGAKKKQGILAIIDGKRSIAYFEKNTLVGYSTMEEIQKKFKEGNIPEFTTEYKKAARD